MSHSVADAWSIHDGRVGVSDCSVMYARPNDTLYVCKVATMFKRRPDGKIYDLRIFGDMTQL
jgi:hypothetical protein